MKTLKTCIGFALTAVAMAAIGSINAGAPGSATIWLGSYHTGAPNEGSLTIGGNTYAFNLLAASLPTGLTLGMNYFFAPLNGGAQGQYDQPTDTMLTSGLSPTRWQGVTVTGLSAGLQPYTITGMNSVNYADWNTSANNWTGSIFIPNSSVVSTPGTLALAGLALLGLGLVRRKA
jgi:hypothetical protein